jgi:hypothetical protein
LLSWAGLGATHAKYRPRSDEVSCGDELGRSGEAARNAGTMNDHLILRLPEFLAADLSPLLASADGGFVDLVWFVVPRSEVLEPRRARKARIGSRKDAKTQRGGRADASFAMSWRLCVLSEAGVSLSAATTSLCGRCIGGAGNHGVHGAFLPLRSSRLRVRTVCSDPCLVSHRVGSDRSPKGGKVSRGAAEAAEGAVTFVWIPA